MFALHNPILPRYIRGSEVNAAVTADLKALDVNRQMFLKQVSTEDFKVVVR